MVLRGRCPVVARLSDDQGFSVDIRVKFTEIGGDKFSLVVGLCTSTYHGGDKG